MPNEIDPDNPVIVDPRERNSEGFVVLDRNDSTLSIALGSSVTRIRYTELESLPLSDYAKELGTRGSDSVIYGFRRYPLLGISRNCGYQSVCVVVQPQKFELRVDPTFSISSEFSSAVIWHPKLVLGLKMTSNYKVLKARLACLIDEGADWKEDTVCKWPLSNVYAGGQLCLGSTESDTYSGYEPKSIEDAIVRFLDVLYGSMWNMDLFRVKSEAFVQRMNRMIKTYDNPTARQIVAALGDSVDRVNCTGFHTMWKILAVLSEPDGWRKLEYDMFSCNLGDFVKETLEFKGGEDGWIYT